MSKKKQQTTSLTNMEHYYSDEEINEMKVDIADKVADVKQYEIDMSDLKSQIKDVNGEINQLNARVKLGYEMRPREVYIKIREDLNKKQYFDPETDEMIKEEDLPPNYQTKVDEGIEPEGEED